MKTLIVFLLSVSYLLAQSPYNHRVENGQIQALGHLIYELDDSYLGIGRGIDTIDYLRGIYASEFDKETGEVINTEKITYSGSILHFDQLNSIIEIDGESFFLFGRSDTIYLTSYNDQSKTLEIEKKIFSAVPTNSLFIYDLKKKDNDIFILASHSTGEFNLVLFRYDVTLDSISETFISDQLGFAQASKMNLLPNDNVLVTYRIFLNGIATQVVKEISFNGEEIWKYTHDIPKENFSFSFQSIGQGEYLVGAAKGKLNPSDPEGEGTPFLMKFNYNQRKVTASTDFNIPDNEWFKWNTAVHEIVPTHDSSAYMCIAQLYEFPLNPDTLQSYGMIAKVDRDLNVIWRRNYARLEGDYFEHRLNDIIATTDGNYLAYGTSVKTFTYPGEIPILSWAIKVDEDGKIVGDTTTSVIDWVQGDLNDEIQIFPNPAIDFININQNDLTKVTYRIYNESGVLEDEFKIRANNTSVMKDISNWSSGMKFIYIIQDNRKMGHMKMFKQ